MPTSFSLGFTQSLARRTRAVNIDPSNIHNFTSFKSMASQQDEPSFALAAARQPQGQHPSPL